jgi:hypothetical protein
LLGTAQFMLILDVAVVAISLPLVGADLALDRQTVTGSSAPTRSPSAACSRPAPAAVIGGDPGGAPMTTFLPHVPGLIFNLRAAVAR